MSASWRPTWAISDTGRKAAIDTRISSGSSVGAIQPCMHQRRADRGDRQAAEPGRHLQAGGLSREIVQQREPHRLVAPRTAP